MPMYRKRSRRQYYDDDDNYSYRPRRRGGCLAPVRRFFRNLLTFFFVAVGGIVFFCLVLLIVFHLAIFVQILVYALYVAAVLLVLGILYLIIRLITAISARMSDASEKRAKAKVAQRRAEIERERVNQARLQVENQEAKLARDAYQFYNQQQDGYYQSPRRTRNFSEEEGYDQPQVRRATRNFHEEESRVSATEEELPEETVEPTELEALGMPAKGQVFAYKDYKKYLKPGQLIIGIRADGTPRVGSWQEFKIMLVLGASSSGKSTTVLEKCLCIVDTGGLLVICDPGGFKPDSIIQRMGSLADAVMPGTSLAIEHGDIMQNVQVFQQELERRRRGASMQTPILLVIDELNGLLMDKEIRKELTQLIEKFAQQARGYNLYMVLCAQRSSGLAAIRNSVISFVCHKCPEMEASKILPARYAKYASQLGVGQTFVSDADGFIDPLQQTLISKKDIEGRSSRRSVPTTDFHTRETEQAPSPRVYGAPSRAQQKLVLPLQDQTEPMPQQATFPISSPEPTAPKVQRRQTASLASPFPKTQRTASPIWGETSPDASLVSPPLSVFPVTEELVPRIPQQQQTQASSLDALAALRDQQAQQRKKK